MSSNNKFYSSKIRKLFANGYEEFRIIEVMGIFYGLDSNRVKNILAKIKRSFNGEY